MPGLEDPRELLDRTFGPGGAIGLISAPGRVNLIGEHIDYHGLPVLPMAMRRSVRVAFRARADRTIRAVSAGGYGCREFAWDPELVPAAAGDWENYLRAAAQAVGRKMGNRPWSRRRHCFRSSRGRRTLVLVGPARSVHPESARSQPAPAILSRS